MRNHAETYALKTMRYDFMWTHFLAKYNLAKVGVASSSLVSRSRFQ